MSVVCKKEFNPNLSICIPTFNRGSLLRECLESIIRAIKYIGSNIEVIISDNASTDNTADIIKNIKLKYPYIDYYKNAENIGGENNFRKVATLATKKYVWVIGDDDKIAKNSIQKVLNVLEDNPSLVILNFSIFSNDFLNQHTYKYHKYKSCYFTKYDDVLVNFGGSIGLISALVLKKEYFETIPSKKYDQFKEYGLSFMYSAYYVALKPGVTIYIEEPIVLNRAENSPISSKWVKYFITGVSLLIDELVKDGYAKSSGIKAKNHHLLSIIIPYLLWRMRNTGNKEDVIIETQKMYKSCIYYYLFFKPISSLPNIMFRSFRILFRKIKPRKNY